MSDGFLNRWSRRKAEAKAGNLEAASPAPAPTEPKAEDAAPAEPPVPDLPPIASLTAQSDFSAFLQAGVPEELRRAALSKLWASDPLFTQPEVFDLHMEDYNAHPLGEVVRTAWKVGKGIVDELADRADTASFPESGENLQTKTKDGETDTPAS